jgi:phosphoenolpyruvate carboxylase
VQTENAEGALAKKLEDFAVRLVLTAHPTQFYPGSVLGIINDLAKSLKENNTSQINMYLQQLGKTPFLNKQKPTPYDEAVSLIWYLENVFYNAIGRIVYYLHQHFQNTIPERPVIAMGFWPGGDRDGNPNVTTATTLKVATALRSSIIKCYYLDVRRLKRRLTFKGVDTILAELETKLYNSLFASESPADLTKEDIAQPLAAIRELLIHQHNSLFLHLLDNLIHKVSVFGLHFATLDVRQESKVHGLVMEAVVQKEKLLPKNYIESDDEQKMIMLSLITGKANPELYDDPLIRDSLESVVAVKTIQDQNGEGGCHRYIISQCNSALNVMEVYGLFLLGGWQPDAMNIDIVPLFETIEDLKNAASIMEALYQNEIYYEHLLHRRKNQTIMVGFSDGTKDGGYLMANWSIYKAKEELTAISKEYGIDVIFFDGRGGPPARGGGKTHKFYASMGKNISTKEIHLTIQGQTVSSSFGTIDAAQYNIEQLLNAGITNELFSSREKTLNPEQEALLQELADESFEAYKQLKNHPEFFNYLSHISPLNFYSETNIGSRPAKRGKATKLSLKDLRAIPFVGAWSQLKQNVPGYYGMGVALQAMEERGKFAALKELYVRSQYFKTLIDNCEMAMKKSFFPLTAFLSDHPQYGELWYLVYDEYERTKKFIFALSGKTELMEDYPVEQLSVQMRERIVLPLTTIQQYAMSCLRGMEERGGNDAQRKIYEKLVIRCSFGIINAGRNSA